MGDRLKDKVAIVVGASTGMGRTTAEVMAREGAHVVAGARNRAVLDEVVSGIRGAGGSATAAPVDIGDEEQIQALVETARTSYGGIDVLVCNAAALDDDVVGVDSVHDVATLPIEVWDQTFHVNTRGTMLCIKHALPHMVMRGGGSIINVTSGLALRGGVSQGAYAASKAALHALTRHVAAAYGKRGIRCNTIVPGLIVSPTARTRRSDEFFDKHLLRTPSTRIGNTDDIAWAMVYLASDESGFVQGQVLCVDGGVTAVGPGFRDDIEMGAARWLDGEQLLEKVRNRS